VRVSIIRLTLVFLVLLTLAACQTTTKKQPTQPQVDDLSLQSPKRQREQVNKAIALLEKGKNQPAKVLLQQVLRFNPTQATALNLTRQLTTPTETLMKTTRYTNYEIKNGDSLGKIARKWLGNSLYFVTLARYNNIENPARLLPGTSIKIPLTEKSDLVIKESRRSSANLKMLAQFISDKSFADGLKRSNSVFITKKHMGDFLKIHQQLLDGFGDYSASLSEKEKMLAEVKVLAKKARNRQQRKQYNRFINQQSLDLYWLEAKFLYADESYFSAAEKLLAARKLGLNLSEETEAFQTQQSLIDKLHEQAIRFYRKHELNKALSYWKLIQQLQPDNALAKKYIGHTQKLLSKLNQY